MNMGVWDFICFLGLLGFDQFEDVFLDEEVGDGLFIWYTLAIHYNRTRCVLFLKHELLIHNSIIPFLILPSELFPVLFKGEW